jgi:hypothetical protein
MTANTIANQHNVFKFSEPFHADDLHALVPGRERIGTSHQAGDKKDKGVVIFTFHHGSARRASGS